MTNPLSPASPLAPDGKKYIPFTLAWKAILIFFFFYPVSPAVIVSLQKENGGWGREVRLMQRGVQVGNLLFLMGCEHCSFKCYCIKPWIPSIIELQNGNKKGGKKIPLPPSWPALQAAPQQDGRRRAHPPRLPSPNVPLGQVSPAPTLALRLRPHPGNKVKGEGFLPPASRPEPRDPMPKFQARLGPARLSQPLALQHLPGPRGSAPCPTGPGEGSADGAHLVPTHPLRTWFRRQEPKQGGQRRNPAGREEENIPETQAAHTRRPAVGRRLAAPGRLPQDTWPPARCSAAGRRGRSGQRDGRRARPRWQPAARAGRGPPPASRLLAAHRVQGRATAAPGGAFVPSEVGRAGRGCVFPSADPGF